MKLKGIFLFLALWGFGATAFALGAGAHRWWHAAAAGALTILALMGAVLAEFAEEYRKRGSAGVAASRQIRQVNDRIDALHEDVHSVREDIDEIAGYLKTIAEAQLILHPQTDLLPSGPPVTRPFAPLPREGVRT